MHVHVCYLNRVELPPREDVELFEEGLLVRETVADVLQSALQHPTTLTQTRAPEWQYSKGLGFRV